MASYRRNQTRQNPASLNVEPATTVLATVPEILAVMDDEEGVDLGSMEVHNDAPANVDAPTPCTTPYSQESISRNF
jgi:hypothetical protein